MKDIKFEIQKGKPKPKYLKVLSKGMLSHHASKGHERNSTFINVWLKNEDDQVVGGVVVTFLWNGMEINSLWVNESMRKQGWGRKLINYVEEEGRKRGCTVSYTNTFLWQAPEFYEKLGYKVYGKLEDFPKGSLLTYFYKQL